MDDPLQDDTLRHAEVQFENAGIRLKSIVAILVCIAGMFLAIIFGAWSYFRIPVPVDAQQMNSYSTPAEHLPKRPRLERLDALSDAPPSKAFTSEFELERRLHSYGPTTEGGFVHVPIEQAMAVAAKMLPVKAVSSEDMEKSFGLLGGGEPDSGRTFQKPPAWWEPQP